MAIVFNIRHQRVDFEVELQVHRRPVDMSAVMGAKHIMLRQLHYDTGMIGVQSTGCARCDHMGGLCSSSPVTQRWISPSHRTRVLHLCGFAISRLLMSRKRGEGAGRGREREIQ